jgi:hypothetical protein
LVEVETAQGRAFTHDRAQAEQELEDVSPDPTKKGHALQQFDSRVNAGVGCRHVAFYVSQMTPLCMREGHAASLQSSRRLQNAQVAGFVTA